MVAGKVKAAMGFQKSPATPKPDTPMHDRHHRRGSSSPGSAASQKPASLPELLPLKSSFPRSFGVYFPRSPKVQPRLSPADVAELLRLVEELRERESRLRTQLLEHKLLRESAAIIPVLEKEISAKVAELESYAGRNQDLEAENESLKREVRSLRARIESDVAEAAKKMLEMEDQIVELKNTIEEQRTNASKAAVSTGVDAEECASSSLSSSQRFQGLMEASAKSNLLKNLRRGFSSFDASATSLPSSKQQQEISDGNCDEGATERIQSPPPPPTSAEALELDVSLVKPRAPRVPKPPPKRCASAPSSSTSSPKSVISTNSETTFEKLSLTALPAAPPPPPPPPPPFRAASRTAIPPAPTPPPALSSALGKAMPPHPPVPPPLPSRRVSSGAATVRRVPEVVEFYHSLMRRDSRRDSSSGVPELTTSASTRSMIGEIENRSAHLLAIKSDVETQGDFIRFLIKEVHDAAFTDIEDVVAFVKWLDDELSFLVDERAVLKHFDWPEQKADGMREAAFGYCDLKKLEAEASSFSDDPRQACGPALKKMRGLLEKLEHGMYNLSRMRESATKRYKEFHIPSEWMLETGFVSQIKLASVKLAMKFMRRISAELEAVGSGPDQEEDLMVQGVRFAFRVHQFAGGFDVETMRAFEELRNKASSCQTKCQTNRQQQKFYCRSSTSC